MSNDVEAGEYDVGTTSVRLIRVGNLIQIVFSSSLEAKLLFSELSAKYKRAQDSIGGV